ncbi:MAG: adenosylmethionine--8-amino-7-oxononanoate transaminase [Verrucomicrobia bacterium]|nr:adenosylmethionine--8-amino-7-oxononanoate transaminase [Verrucomicrobiota bacterium]
MGTTAHATDRATPCKTVERNLGLVWHPFTQALGAPPPLPIVRGEGAYLYSATGEPYLDAISSWWVNLHGHAHPYIAEKIAAQARTLEHVIFAGYTHPQAILLAERLLALFSSQYSHVFYSDNGSTAVEVALKMALQAQGNEKKLLSFQGSYFGDTFGAMAASGRSHYNRPFWPYLFPVHSIVPPTPAREEESWRAFETALSTGEIGIFIFEPIIQGSGGMRPHCGKWLSKMIQKCQESGIITIADEVLTGFGRTGPLFASNTLTALPDIICLAKGLTGGFLPLGATLTRRFIFESFLSPDPTRSTFLHGHSYTANPLACAAANASLDLLLQPSCEKARQMIESEHLQFQKQWRFSPQLTRCDVVGTILALEYRIEHPSYHHPLKQRLIEFFHSKGILLRPIGNVLYLIPPYCITSDELKKIYAAIITTLEERI